jgi:membrane-bound lytic murein transglycosylase D
LFEPKSTRVHWLSLALLLAPLMWGAPLKADTSEAFAYPPELEPDVRFWIRIYTEVTTDQGLLHDDWYLGLVYEALRFDPSDSPRQREHIVEQAKARYAALLRRFAAGDTENLTPHERRILHAFGDKTTPAQYREAIERIRFQPGRPLSRRPDPRPGV